jgi:hypothetical protein
MLVDLLADQFWGFCLEAASCGPTLQQGRKKAIDSEVENLT